MKVWLVGEGEYEQHGVIGVYASPRAAYEMTKAKYGHPYQVRWTEPKDQDGWVYFEGHFEAVPGLSTEHVAVFDVSEWEVQG